ncbi:MAG: glycoside hydrolase [Halobacteriales archaeon]|nr:glycoside hydrolase [Halobacteriales archaeon]
MRPVPLAVALGIALAGCVAKAPSPAPEAPEETPPWLAALPALEGCNRCFEASVAVDDAGRIVATVEEGEALAVSEDGGATFAAVAAPPLPATLLGSGRTDALVEAAPDGRLLYSALVQELTEGAVAQWSLQAATSQDGGRTWLTNVFLSPFLLPATLPVSADRQWFVAGTDGAAYIVWGHYAGSLDLPTGWQTLGTGLYVLASKDGGRTFGQPVLAASKAQDGALGAGHPVVRRDGSLWVPYATSGFPSGRVNLRTDYPVAAAVSTDGGATFQSHVLHQDPAGFVAIWPFLAERDGKLALAWWDLRGNGTIQGLDLEAGAAPVQWGGPNATKGPWVSPDASTIAWWQAQGKEYALHIARPLLGRDDVVAGPLQGMPGRGPSDFAAVALLPDGRAVTAWGDGEGTLWVRAEAPRIGAPLA